jgi:hypothetical protein
MAWYAVGQHLLKLISTKFVDNHPSQDAAGSAINKGQEVDPVFSR